MHLLIWLENREDFLRPEIIDQVVCAELPSADIDPDGILTDLVRQFMIHSPCNNPAINKDVTCLDDDPKTGQLHCSKWFSKH